MRSIEDFIFLFNSQFFKIKEDYTERFITPVIKTYFQSCLKKISSKNVYIKKIREDYDNVKYSLLAYKFPMNPSCLIEEVDSKWQEVKFAYILVVEYSGYMAITKRLVPSINPIKSILDNIEYQIMENLLIHENSIFQRFNLKNLDTRISAMKSKVVEAYDLSKSFPSLGAQSYKLNSYRMQNGDQIISVQMEAGKLNKVGLKVGYEELFTWMKAMIDAIIDFSQENMRDNFLSVFASPTSYTQEYNTGNLIPNSILINLNPLLDDNNLSIVEMNDNNERENLNKSKFIKLFEEPFLLNRTEDQPEEFEFKKNDETFLKVIVGPSSISLKSDFLKSKGINNEENENCEPLLDYIKENDLYVISFEDINLSFSGNTLFRNSNIWARTKEFMEIFDPRIEHIMIKSEKGKTKTQFKANSLFGFCETEFMKENSIMICDDLGTEWADYIQIGNDYVKLFASKYSDKKFSASAFHDIVSQVLKNLGALDLFQFSRESVLEKWNGNYPDSNIPRVRTRGKTAVDAIDKWETALKNPNFRCDVYLIVNFIGKDDLEDIINKIKRGEKFKRNRAQCIQIMWLLNSLIAACQNINMGIHIICCKTTKDN